MPERVDDAPRARTPGRTPGRAPGRAPTVYDAHRDADAAARARMPLIDLVASSALDEEYVEVARRRHPFPAADPGRRRPGVLAAVAVVVFAALVTISFQQTRDNEDVADAGRVTLEDRIRARRGSVSDAQERIADLRRANRSAESTVEALDRTDTATQARLDQLRLTTGLAVTTGEGIRITVDDSPDGLDRHRVYATDLALLVNGLWEAGAQAVAVNGQRLTSVSAFRSSGGTVGVNRVDLSPPYTVEALGDRRRLAADLLDTTTGLAFQARAEEFGFVAPMPQNVQRLTLPAAPARLVAGLRSARPAPGGDLPPAREEQDP